jgi:hypothetical protein
MTMVIGDILFFAGAIAIFLPLVFYQVRNGQVKMCQYL